MKQKEIFTTLAIAGAIVATHHSTPTHNDHTVKTHRTREVTLLASQGNNTIGQVSNTSFLHFRSGPTTNDSIIRTLNGNQKMIILGTYGDWYKVNINGTIGYVYSSYIEILNNSETNSNYTGEIGTLVNTTFLHLRDSATTNSNILKTLYSNDEIIVLAKDGAWYKVNVNGQIGYVYGYYLNVSNQSTPESNNNNDTTSTAQGIGNGALINTTFLHFRSSDSIYSDILSTLNTSSNITVLSKDGEWYKVEVNGQVGYVYGYYLQVSSNQDNNSLPSSNTNSSNNSSTQGSIGTGHLINTTFLHFRSAATLDSDIISTLSENSQIKVLKKVGSWYEVNVNGQVGYVYGYYLSVTGNSSPDSNIKSKPVAPESQGIGSGNLINTTFLHLRDSATTNSNILETIYNNDKITVLSKDGAWYKVNVNGNIGYVYGYYLNVDYNHTANTNIGDNTTNPSSNIVVGQVINSSYLHVRAGAGTNFSILEDIYRGNKVEVMKKLGNWYEIKVNGKIGYVYDYYLEIVSGSLSDNSSNNDDSNNSTTNIEHGIVINLSSLNIRNQPSTNSKVLGTLSKGDSVSILSGKNGWFKIYYNGSDAYVSANYIELTSPYNNTENSNDDNVTSFSATGNINSYMANIRANASLSCAIIGQETINSPVVITGEKGDFYQVKLGNKYGFISKKLISVTSTYDSSNDTKPDSSNSTNTTNTTTEINTNYPINLNDYVNMEYSNWPLFSKQEFMNAIDPQDIDNMFEFLRIDKFRNINISKLNQLLNGKGVLSGQGQAFSNACQKYNIDPLYFVDQSILETGYGRSLLAKGVTISEIAIQSKPIYNSQGQLVGYHMQQLPHPVTVYNLFGIGAEDNSSVFPDRALILGTTYAYTHGWTSVSSAIAGAAEFVSSNYIHNSYYAQNTVYKLRFSPQISSIWHQYSTDVWYAKSIANLMKEHMDIYSSSDQFTYDVPVFKS
ncbi:MAG: SH3 domain-containing protein [Sarcina sp.]